MLHSTKVDSTGSLIINPPRTCLNPSILTSTTYPFNHSGLGLRQLQRRFWTSQPRKNLQIRHRIIKIISPPGIQIQPNLSLYMPSPIKNGQRGLPHLRFYSKFLVKQIISLRFTAKEAYLPFQKVPLRPFMDAGYAQSTYKCTVLDLVCSCWTV